MMELMKRLGSYLFALFRRQGCWGKVGLLVAGSLILLCPCVGILSALPSPRTPTPTIDPFGPPPLTDTPHPTNTATPAIQPLFPTATPEPTDIPQPIATPEPTATLLPSPTPTPEPTATPLSSPTSTPERQQAQTVRIIDGHTIEVQIGDATYTVRYIGIDTPETKHPDKPVEWMGPEAAAQNEALVGGQMVELEKDVSETDQYGRLLRYVWMGDVMVNAKLVRLGYAQVSTYPPDVKHADLFLQLQQEAREAERGLWGPTPTAPPVPTATAVPPTAPPAPVGAVIHIVQVDKRAEFVDIRNDGDQPQDLSGWVLVSERGNQSCSLGGVIGPDEMLRIWAMAEDQGEGGYNCGFGTNIWNNSEPDPAVLYDAAGGRLTDIPKMSQERQQQTPTYTKMLGQKSAVCSCCGRSEIL